MAGVRGFADPNVQMNPSNNKSIWYQYAPSLSPFLPSCSRIHFVYNIPFT